MFTIAASMAPDNSKAKIRPDTDWPLSLFAEIG
jgi:hypothetical protein